MTEHVFYHEHMFGVKAETLTVQRVTTVVYALLAVVFVFTSRSRFRNRSSLRSRP